MRLINLRVSSMSPLLCRDQNQQAARVTLQGSRGPVRPAGFILFVQGTDLLHNQTSVFLSDLMKPASDQAVIDWCRHAWIIIG